MMHYIFASFPGWLILSWFIAASFVVTYLIFKVSKYLFSETLLEKYQDITGVFVNMIGVLYGVLLAFIVVAIWEHYNDARQITENEANDLAKIYTDAQILPEQVRNRIDSAEKVYVQLVINVEWVKLSRFEESEKAVDAEYSLMNIVRNYEPKNSKEEKVYSQIVTYLNDFADARRSRVSETNAEIPFVIWIVLIGGALLVIVYFSFFNIQNKAFHLWPGFGISVFIAILFFISLDLNYPFT